MLKNKVITSKETFYFSHDYNTREDEKIKELVYKNGMLGYGIYWAIVEMLYQNANALRTNYNRIAFDIHQSSDETVKSVITDFELFSFSEDGEYFYSESIERRLEKRNDKSEKARQSALNRWNRSEGNANALETHSESDAIKESKGKESKVNILLEKETKHTSFNFRKSLEEKSLDNNLVDEWMIVRKKLKAVDTETAFKKFISEVIKSGKTIDYVLKLCIEKSWRGFSADWIPYESISENNPEIVKYVVPEEDDKW